MAVYIDDMEAAFGRMVMCHMVADSREELDAMADKIGVQRKWIQKAGTYLEHYDVCLAKRKLAIKHGAVEITWNQLGHRLLRLRKKESNHGNKRKGVSASSRTHPGQDV